MKNILIIGTARAGKTTLSRMLKEKYPSMNLLIMDSIKNAVIRNMDGFDANDFEKITEFEFSKFNTNMIFDIYNSHIKNDINNYGYILEGSQLLPEFIKNNTELKDIVVVCLGHGNLSAIDIFNLCRKNDTINDWTYGVSNDKLIIMCKQWEKLNNQLKIECEKYNIKRFETDDDRKKVLLEAMDYISDNL